VIFWHDYNEAKLRILERGAGVPCVAAGYKAALRDAQAEKQPTPKDRVIAEQDQRIEADGKLIRDLKHQLDDHEWDHGDEVSELIARLGVKLRNHSAVDQAFAINELLRVLGWSGPMLDAIRRVTKGPGLKDILMTLPISSQYLIEGLVRWGSSNPTSVADASFGRSLPRISDLPFRGRCLNRGVSACRQFEALGLNRNNSAKGRVSSGRVNEPSGSR